MLRPLTGFLLRRGQRGVEATARTSWLLASTSLAHWIPSKPHNAWATLSTTSLTALAAEVVARTDAERAIAAKLATAFAHAARITVADTSGGCGAMYDIEVVSPDFKGLSIVKQHQAVHRALKDDIAQWHGFNLVTTDK